MLLTEPKKFNRINGLLLNEAERGRHLQKKRRLQGCEDEVCYDFYSFILFALCFLIPIVFFLPSKMVECS